MIDKLANREPISISLIKEIHKQLTKGTYDEVRYGNAMADSSCALENMMIAANALDLGSCWINQLHWLDENPTLRNYLEELGLKNGNHKGLLN